MSDMDRMPTAKERLTYRKWQEQRRKAKWEAENTRVVVRTELTPHGPNRYLSREMKPGAKMYEPREE